MESGVTSRQVWNASELLVLAPIKQGFVPTVQTMSYASRLRLLLTNLFKTRRLNVERDQLRAAGPIERLQTLFDSQWTVLRDDRHLLVTVSFSSSWEEYFQRLVREAGPALDLIFHHCEHYADFSCVGPKLELRYQGFADWVRRHQVPCDFYYPTAPDVTVDDITYMRKRAGQRAVSAKAAAELRVDAPEVESRRHAFEALVRRHMAADPTRTRRAAEAHANQHLDLEREERARETLRGFFQLRETFPEAQERGSDAPTIFDVAVRNLVPDCDVVNPGDPADPFEGWLARVAGLTPRTPEPAEPPRLGRETLENVQGNILTGYERMTHGCLVLLRCAGSEAARGFLREMIGQVTTHAKAKGAGPFTNLAVTLAGFERLGLNGDALEWLPNEFREGMEQRSGTLGDVGEPNHPHHWQRPRANWCGPGKPFTKAGRRLSLSAVDFVVLLQARCPGATHEWPGHPLHDRVAALEGAGARILHVQLLQREDAPHVYEHFGFVDGLSQPVPNAVLDGQALACPGGAPAAERDRVALGEFLLGYPDARGELRWCADRARNESSHELFRNGSFLVFRKLEQDVQGFLDFAKENATALQLPEEEIEARIVGRERDGTPLVEGAGPGNDFDYEKDREGSRCPLHAHIRRANPRPGGGDPHAVPRILRRGFSYGPRHAAAPEQERGLLFMAFNASIASQFEVIQGWINGSNPTGNHSAQRDLFSGAPHPADAAHWLHDGRRWKGLVPPRKPLVSLRWGLYSFVPSKKGLEWLAGKKADASREAGERAQLRELVAGGRVLIEALQELERKEGRDAARDAWRSVIEEPKKSRQAIALWAAIRHGEGGVLHTPYGMLVGSAAGAREVLSDHGRRFSVREYWHRLRASAGEHYIAFDPAPAELPAEDPAARRSHAQYEARLGEPGVGHREFGELPNRFIVENFNDTGRFRREQARAAAYEIARQALDDGQGQVELRQLATRVVAALAKTWFGVPGDSLLRVIRASQYAFQPYPGNTLAREATRPGTVNVEEDTEFFRSLDRSGCPRHRIESAMVGSTVGFAAPAIASAVTVLLRWARSDALLDLAESWRAHGSPEEREQAWPELEKLVVKALVETPIPPLLYRTAMPGASIAGQDVAPGTPVIVGLGSVAFDDPANGFEWLFGGPRSVNPHGCPGRGAAIGTTVGIVAALLDRNELRYERGFVVSYEG